MPFAKICDIQFECPMKFPLQPACVSFSPDNVTVPDDAELAAFFKDLHEVNPKAAIQSIVPRYCDSFNPTSQSSLLPPLKSICYPEIMKFTSSAIRYLPKHNLAEHLHSVICFSYLTQMGYRT